MRVSQLGGISRAVSRKAVVHVGIVLTHRCCRVTTNKKYPRAVPATTGLLRQIGARSRASGRNWTSRPIKAGEAYLINYIQSLLQAVYSGVASPRHASNKLNT